MAGSWATSRPLRVDAPDAHTLRLAPLAPLAPRAGARAPHRARRRARRVRVRGGGPREPLGHGAGLGVSVLGAVRLASRSAMASFSDTVDAVTGRANLEIAAVADGFDERLYARIRRAPGVRAAAPVVEVSALASAGAPRRA